jgi:hypothetical protein
VATRITGGYPVSKIFISYRHDDDAFAAEHLHWDLAQHFGDQNVFLDKSSLKPGDRFDPVIAEALASCKVLIALIGRNWVSITEERQLTPDKDFVLWEISTVLKRTGSETGSPVAIIPVLVGGAQLPKVEDLPDDLIGLVGNIKHELRAFEWEEDLAALVRAIEVRIEPDYKYSMLGGATAGLVTALIVGVFYYMANRNNPIPKDRVEWTRIISGCLFGVLAGAIISWCINKGVNLFSKWLTYAPYSKVIGAILGGTAGGLAACVIAGISFARLPGRGAEPGHVILAVAISTICIVLGMIWPDMKSGWWEKFITTVILVSVTFTAVRAAEEFLDNQVQGLKTKLEAGTPLSRDILILGAICGIMAGLQAGMAIFFYDRRRK